MYLVFVYNVFMTINKENSKQILDFLNVTKVKRNS